MSRFRGTSPYPFMLAILALGLLVGAGCKKERGRSRGSGPSARSQAKAGTARHAKSGGKTKRGNKKANAGKRNQGRKANASGKKRQTSRNRNKKAGKSSSTRENGDSRTAGGSALEASSKALDGIRLTVPMGWLVSEMDDNEAGIRACYRLPKSMADHDDVTVVVVHIPTIRGQEKEQLLEWFEKKLLPDGIPLVEAVHQRTVALTGIHVTIAEMTGTLVDDERRDAGFEVQPYRMLVAILDHPQGPHVVRIIGPASSFRNWEATMMKFLGSARLVPQKS